MGTCVFKTADIRRCVAHALAAPKWDMGYATSTPPAPALLFVHDQGVYLMSNGTPRDVLAPAAKDSSAYVAYADGCNPAVGTFDDWYGQSRNLVGGDDFVEVLPITPRWLAACDEFEEFTVTMTAATLDATFAKPRSRTEVPA